MKKILFIITGLSNYGGTERVVSELSNELSQLYQIDIIYRAKYGSRLSYSFSNRINLIHINGGYFKFLSFCKKKINPENYDRVFIHSMIRLTPALLAIGVKHPFLYSVEHISHKLTNFFYYLIKKIVYKKLRGIIVLSTGDLNFYSTLHCNVIKVNNPAPYSIQDSYNLENTTVIAIGSLIKRKGYHQLIKAWSLIEDKIPEFKLEIYGKGPEKEYLQSLIDKLGVKSIFLKGTSSEVSLLYKNAAFFVMSSSFEGLPMVLIEAQTFGLPIVSFDCPYGPAEIVSNNVNGFLVENQNVSLLADAILKLANAPEQRKQFSMEALIAANRYSKNRVISHWQEIIEAT